MVYFMWCLSMMILFQSSKLLSLSVIYTELLWTQLDYFRLTFEHLWSELYFWGSWVISKNCSKTKVVPSFKVFLSKYLITKSVLTSTYCNEDDGSAQNTFTFLKFLYNSPYCVAYSTIFLHKKIYISKIEKFQDVSL